MADTLPPAPLIFVHRGNAQHLFLAALQARRENPLRDVILLGDETTAHFRGMLGIRHVPLTPYLKGARRLDATFQNDSSNGRQFEMFCLQRWFILQEFLQANQMARCIHLDSDILVYGDLREPEADFADYPMTMQACAGHSSFINSPAVLAEFTNFMLEHYENPACQAELHQHTASIRRHNPSWNVSDMSFFLMFHAEQPAKLVDLQFPTPRGYALDQAFDSDHGGFELEGGHKKIVWQAGLPCCRHLPTGSLVRFCTLHFQGGSKRQMPRYCRSLGIGPQLRCAVNRLRILGAQVRRRVSRQAGSMQLNRE